MKTTIILDETLIKEAFGYTHVTTKNELIDLVLREFERPACWVTLRSTQPTPTCQPYTFCGT